MAEWGGWSVFIRFGACDWTHFFAHIPDFVTATESSQILQQIWPDSTVEFEIPDSTVEFLQKTVLATEGQFV